jgi:flagellar hook-associated protein 3 FlgL
MTFRVTQRSIGERSLANLQTNLDAMAKLQQQLSSGKLISQPSDDPAGTVSAMQFRTDIRTNQQWSRNAQDGISWLNTIDSALSSSMDNLQRVRDLTVQGSSTGSMDDTARAALATEVDSIRQGLIGTANTTYLGRPVFGGTTGGTQAYNADGTYAGDTSSVNRTVGAGSSVQVDANGKAVFGADTDPTNLFTVLAQISTDLRSGSSSGLSAGLGNLDAAMNRIKTVQADVGARTNRITQLKQDADDRVLSLKSSLSDVEDIDLPSTIVNLQMQQTAYQAALGATAKAVQPSLMDFLK